MGIDPDIGGAVAILRGKQQPRTPADYAQLELEVLDAPAISTDNSKRKFRHAERAPSTGSRCAWLLKHA